MSNKDSAYSFLKGLLVQCQIKSAPLDKMNSPLPFLAKPKLVIPLPQQPQTYATRELQDFNFPGKY